MDASHRRTIPEDALLRQSEDGRVARRQSLAGATSDAIDGLGGDLSQAAPFAERRGASNLPVFAAKSGHCAADQVWSSDITYVPMPHGWMYLTVVMDWYSRYVLSWRLSNTLDGQFCLEALEEALARGTPEIFNTDQGVQYTATAFTARLELAGVAISMDGRGRWMDNVFVERLWRTVKYECLYLHDFATVRALEAGLARFFQFYNDERIHAALDYLTPALMYAAA
jgi:putative transposase